MYGSASYTRAINVKCRAHCDRTVIRSPQNLEEHGGLRTHTEQLIWKVKLLIAYASTRFRVAWYRSPVSLSKRAPSTTRRTLRVFTINSYGPVAEPETPNCVRPPNVPRSLTRMRQLLTGLRHPSPAAPSISCSVVKTGPAEASFQLGQGSRELSAPECPVNSRSSPAWPGMPSQ